MDTENAGERPGLVAQTVGAVGAAAIRDGDGDDDSLVLDSLALRAHAAVEVGRSAAERSVGLAGRPGAPRLGAQREILRKPESGVPDPNAAEGLAATGGRPEGDQNFRAEGGRPEVARESIKPRWRGGIEPVVVRGARDTTLSTQGIALNRIEVSTLRD